MRLKEQPFVPVYGSGHFGFLVMQSRRMSE
jgi:hypothetical protein